MKKPNKFAHMADGTVIVMLERKDGTALPCFVDAADWERVRAHKWYALPNGRTCYAGANVKNGLRWESFKMHVLLLLPDGQSVDHCHGNGLNNRRYNLRVATTMQNARNRRKSLRNNKGVLSASKFKGVYWNRKRNKWEAHIKLNGMRKYIGLFSDEVDAASAYDAAALQHFAEFARLNFPVLTEAA